MTFRVVAASNVCHSLILFNLQNTMQQQKRRPVPHILFQHFPKGHVALGVALLLTFGGIFLFHSNTPAVQKQIDIPLKITTSPSASFSTPEFAETPVPAVVVDEDVESPEAIQEISVDTPEAIEPTVAETFSWKSTKVAKGDSLSKIFSRMGYSATTLHKLMTTAENAKLLKKIYPGQTIDFQEDHEGNLTGLRYEPTKLEVLSISKDDDSYQSELTAKPVETRLVYAKGKIDSNLFVAAKEAGMSDAMTMSLANIFGWDIDFALDIRGGDSFELLYELKYVENQKIGEGNVLVANFTNRDKTYTAIRYEDKSGRVDYYDEKGNSIRKTFIRTPVDFTRISSKFNPNRLHPIFKTARPHKGVDYAAPSGTPVKAAGDGKVIVARQKGGYGNAVVIQHGQTYSTLYGHLSKFGRGIREGKRVKQGQIIGYVGSTGWATGPHLHYEFRVNGVHRNPLTVKLPDGAPINKQYREDFLAHAAAIRGQLALHSDHNSTLAKNEFE